MPKVVTSKVALLARVDMVVKLVSQVEVSLLTLSKVGNELVYLMVTTLRRPSQATHKEVISSRAISKEQPSRRGATNKEATAVAINVSPSVVSSPFLG